MIQYVVSELYDEWGLARSKCIGEVSEYERGRKVLTRGTERVKGFLRHVALILDHFRIRSGADSVSVNPSNVRYLTTIR